jgi:hypothetical protein
MRNEFPLFDTGNSIPTSFFLPEYWQHYKNKTVMLFDCLIDGGVATRREKG